MAVPLSTPLPAPVVAHGLGDAADLPVPFPLLVLAAAAAVVATAGWLSARAGRTGELSPPPPHPRVLPAWVTAAADHPATRAVLRLVATAVLAVVAVTAAFGAPTDATNPAPRLLYAVFWPGLLALSVLLGPVWRAVSPPRWVWRAVARLSGDPDEATTRTLPEGVGVWPAAVGLVVFAWSELVAPASPAIAAAVVVGYVLAMVSGAAVFGSAWFTASDPFEVASTLLGRLSPLGRTDDGRLALRSPRQTLRATPLPPGLLATVAALVGAHLYDGVTGTQAWQGTVLGSGWRVVPEGSVALLGCIAVAWLVGWLAVRVRALLPALVPVVAGYAFAHYFAVFLIDGQVALAQLSDPFGTGLDLFGTGEVTASYDLLPGALAAAVRLLGFVGGHVAAVVVGHHLAVARFDLRGARAVQFPLRAALVGSTVGGIFLLFTGG